MKYLIISIYLLISSHCCYANTGWWFYGQKEGITIIVPCAYEDSIFERKQQEAFLDRLVKKLNRKDTSLKILLLVNPMTMYPGWGTENYWFATVAYDRLQNPDLNFIEDYYDYRSDDAANRQMLISNKPQSKKYAIDLPEPLDINASYNDQPAVHGLKIICGYLHWDSVSSYDRFYTLIRYGIDHIEEIKKNQGKIVIPGWYSGIKVSINTIDTGFIKSLPLLSLGFDPKLPEKKVFPWILIGGIVGLILLIIFIINRRVRSTQKPANQ